MAKRKEDPVPEDVQDRLELMPLGAGNEVGRSCVYMSYKGKNVLFDCGYHPGKSGLAGLPFFDHIDTSTIHLLLITHFHLDHAAALPFFLNKTTFKGRVFMTHATKAIYKLQLMDFVRVSKVATEESLFSEDEIQDSMKKIEVIDFHQVQEVSGIKFWCYTAGHVLGAAMFAVDINGVRVLYTGDYSREEDRHLKSAEIPGFCPQLCVIEATSGDSIHEPREIRERRFLDIVTSTVLGGGRLLIPSFASGRSQELLLILDEHWQLHPELHKIPVFYASPLAERILAVYRTYIGSMNDSIQQQATDSNPFDFKFIQSFRNVAKLENSGPCVVMASPGGLQSGLARELFDKWCGDRRNTCLIPGFAPEGTLTKTLLSEPDKVTLMNGTKVPLHMKVEYVSFAAHADFQQTTEFLEELDPPNIVLVHGEYNKMKQLQTRLLEQFKDRNGTVLTPANTESVEFFFKGQKMAKAVGRIIHPPKKEESAKEAVKDEVGCTEAVPGAGEIVQGVMVKKEFDYKVMAPEDLQSYTQLTTAAVVQRLTIPYNGPFRAVQGRLENMFEGVEPVPSGSSSSSSSSAAGGALAVSVGGRVTVCREGDDRVVLEWVSDTITDMIADAVIAAILLLEGAGKVATEESEGGQSDARAEVKQRGGEAEFVGNGKGVKEREKEEKPNESVRSSKAQREVELVKDLLVEMFGDVDERKKQDGLLVVKVDGKEASVQLPLGTVECKDEGLGGQVRSAVNRLFGATRPIRLR